MVIETPGKDLDRQELGVVMVVQAGVTTPVYSAVWFEQGDDFYYLLLNILFGAEVYAAETQGDIKFLIYFQILDAYPVIRLVIYRVDPDNLEAILEPVVAAPHVEDQFVSVDMFQ